MPSGAAGSEHVLRVLKLTSFCSSCCRRASEIDPTSFSIRGSMVCAWTGAWSTTAAMSAPHQTAFALGTFGTLSTLSTRTISTPAPLAPSAPLSDLRVFEIVPRRDARRAPKRGVVEVDPRAGPGAVGQHDVRLGAHVEAAIGIVVSVTLEVVELSLIHISEPT